MVYFTSHKDAYMQNLARATNIMTHMWMYHDFTIYSHNIQYIPFPFIFSSSLTFQPAASYTLLYLLYVLMKYKRAIYQQGNDIQIRLKQKKILYS